MHWLLVRDKVCWWLTAEAGGFAERISQPKVTGQRVEQFMFSVLKKRSLLDDETLVSFSEVTWVVVRGLVWLGWVLRSAMWTPVI